jgi:hypothetical protein
MITIFPPFGAYEELNDHIKNLLRMGISFEVTLVVDKNNKPHHWEVEEK